MKIIYEPHPISPARKEKLQAQGYKIIDAVFAPPGTPIHVKLEVEAEEEVKEETAPASEPEVAEDVAEVVETEDEAEEAPVNRKRGRPRKE